MMKEREFGEDCCVHVALFTAGIAVLMAYFKRALMAVFQVEQWRSFVFVILNLLLLAIVVTSTCNLNLKALTNNNKNKNKKIINKCCSSDIQESTISTAKKISDDCEEKKIVYHEIINTHCVDNHDEVISCREEEEEERIESRRLSKEEVNERAEAFIIMFRQHLVLDARKPLLSKSSII